MCGAKTVEERMPGVHGMTHKQDRCPRCMWVGPPVFMGTSGIADTDDAGAGEDETGASDPD